MSLSRVTDSGRACDAAHVTLDDLTRKKERRHRDREALDALLDEQLVGTLSAVTTDGEPWAVPMLFARDGDRLLLHGSTGAGALRHVADDAPAVFSVFAVDALVLATSMFDHSANYRSATVRGRLQRLEGDAAWTALDLVSDGLIPGRRDEVVPMSTKDVAATVALAMDITEDNWILKARTGGADEDPEHPGMWTGVVPVETSYGDPQPSSGAEDLPTPPSVRRLVDGP